MTSDGTLILHLRAEGAGGSHGDALVQFAPDHPKFKYHLKHLGEMKPGDSKPIPPYCD